MARLCGRFMKRRHTVPVDELRLSRPRRQEPLIVQRELNACRSEIAIRPADVSRLSAPARPSNKNYPFHIGFPKQPKRKYDARVFFPLTFGFDQVRSRTTASYVQPRSRKIRSRIGIGIPRSQSKMYPVAPVCLIPLVKRIDTPFLVIDSRPADILGGRTF